MKQKYEKPYLNFFAASLRDVICMSGIADDPWLDEW